MNAKDELAMLQAKLDSGKLSPDEPLFVLRAQDKLAPVVIRVWVDLLDFANDGVGTDKAVEAIALAEKMEAWSPRKIPD